MLSDELINVSFATTTSTHALPSGTYFLKPCIFDSSKGTFQLADRSGFDPSCCIFYKHSIRWGENSDACSQKEKWSIEDINCAALKKFQKISASEDYVSAGIRRHDLLLLMPVEGILLHMIYLLFGLGNDFCTNFKDFIAQRT